MYADTLFRAEQMHLFGLLIWGGASVVVGAVLWGLLAWRRSRSPLVTHFAIQTLAWGGVVLALAGRGWSTLAMRDHAGAVRVDRLLWLNVGLDAGYAGIGATLAIAGWLFGRRLGAVGAGLAVVVQGAALAALDLAVALQIQR
jgi:hypothetical protein